MEETTVCHTLIAALPVKIGHTTERVLLRMMPVTEDDTDRLVDPCFARSLSSFILLIPDFKEASVFRLSLSLIRSLPMIGLAYMRVGETATYHMRNTASAGGRFDLYSGRLGFASSKTPLCRAC